MSDDGTTPTDAEESAGSVQADLSPWESPHDTTDDPEDSADSDGPEASADAIADDTDTATVTTQDTADEDEPDADESDTKPAEAAAELADIDWECREIGESYPVDANYHCNECNDFSSDTLRELKTHVVEDETISWGEYLEASSLHRCADCGDALNSLADLYCDDCTKHPNDRIPCRNCGTVRVKISDPFCSPECAGERIEATDGPPNPLAAPNNPDDEWLDHPHRLPAGIPSGAPFIENHQLACRECYGYGSDSLHEFAVHVSEKHTEHGWGGYINAYALRRCRVCGDALHSLLPLYCSDVCQRSDPNPAKTCARNECGAAVERRQTYCSRSCYTTSTS